MKQGVGNKTVGSRSSVGSALRGAGRVAIWVTIGLLLIRGVISTAAPETPPTSGGSALATDPQSESLAIRFARAYLRDPSAASLAPYLADGVRVPPGVPPRTDESQVAQAEVSGVQRLDRETSIFTVACELRDARTLFLAVPISRSRAGEAAALGAPSLVAAPGLAEADVESQPVAGPDAGAIEDLAGRFLPEYVAATDAAELSYFVQPGSTVQPLAAAVQFVSLASVSQLGDGEGARRTVLAGVRVADPASGATYPLAYRLSVVKGARWYVSAIQGASA